MQSERRLHRTMKDPSRSMDIEDSLIRPQPTVAYRPTPLTLRIPKAAIAGTLLLLQRAGRRESCVFWYGLRDSLGGGEVKYIVAPRQTMSLGNYGVSAQALTEIVATLPDHWKVLAQIHSHPGARVEHSNYDDRMISSRR